MIRAVTLLLLAARASAVSEVCATLRSVDALLVVDMQNCFLEPRPLRPNASTFYAIPADVDTSDGTLPGGRLAVTDAANDIVDVANGWLAYARGGEATVAFSLDWHPPGHCSFCEVDGAEIPVGTACVTGSMAAGNDGYGARCVDAVSDRDYDAQAYFQWPSHCVAGSFDSYLDPYLGPLPLDASYVKLGTEPTTDSYSGFDGGAVSASSGRADFTGNASRAFLEPDASLASVLEEAGARRLFVMGLATDYVVKNTVFDALHANDFLPPGYGARLPANLSQVVLVDAATRAVVPTLGEVVKADVVAKGGAVVYAAGARDAMVELCAGTCDGQADCGAGEYCSPNADAEAFPWGACAACPGAAAPCGGRGNCTEAGSCACDAGWRGDACESPSCPAGTYVDGEACAPCPAGTASSIENAPVCPICGLVEYQPSTGATACEACPANAWRLWTTLAAGGDSEALAASAASCTCERGFYSGGHNASKDAKRDAATWGLGGYACAPCPAHATCGGDRAAPVNEAGHWGFPEAPYAFYACDDGRCGAAYECRAGWGGAMCENLERFEYWAISGFPGAFRCPRAPWRLALSYAALFASVLGFWYAVNVVALPNLGAFSVFLDHVQTMAIVVSFADADWPRVMDFVNPAFQVLLFDVDVLSPNCVVPWRSQQSFCAQIVLALTGLLSFGPVVANVARRLWFDETERTWAKVRNHWFHRDDHLAVERAIGTAFSTVEVTFPTLNVLAFSALRCETLADGRSYMLFDPDIRCDGGATHVAITALAALTLCALVALPLHLVLFRVRAELARHDGVHRASFRRKYGFAVEAYRAPHFYWKALNMYRTVLVCACGTQLARGPLQAFWLDVVLACTLAAQVRCAPHRDAGANVMETFGGGLCLLFSLSTNLLSLESTHAAWGAAFSSLLFAFFAMGCAYDVRALRDSAAAKRAVARVLDRATPSNDVDGLVLELCAFRASGRSLLHEVLANLYTARPSETTKRPSAILRGVTTRFDAVDDDLVAAVSADGAGAARAVSGRSLGDAGLEASLAVLDMASRSLEDLARALAPARLEAHVQSRRDEDLARVVRVAAAAQRFLSEEAPISSYSTNARAAFWRGLVAARPGVVRAACSMSAGEREILFGSLVWLEKASCSCDIADAVSPEALPALFYALLALPDADAGALAALLRGVADADEPRSVRSPRFASAANLLWPEIPQTHSAFRDWKARELAAIDAVARAGAAPPEDGDEGDDRETPPSTAEAARASSLVDSSFFTGDRARSESPAGGSPAGPQATWITCVGFELQ